MSVISETNRGRLSHRYASSTQANYRTEVETFSLDIIELYVQAVHVRCFEQGERPSDERSVLAPATGVKAGDYEVATTTVYRPKGLILVAVPIKLAGLGIYRQCNLMQLPKPRTEY